MNETEGSQVPAIRPDDSLSAEQVLGQVKLITDVKAAVMKEGVHYGVIEGCKNPSLYKAGAEKLCLTFRLAPRVVSEAIIELGKGHREYRIVLGLYKIGSDNVWGEGVGSCSTMEGKYRFRTGAKNVTDKEVPKNYWDLRKKNPEAAEKLIGAGNSVKKVTDEKTKKSTWFITEGGGAKVEHDNPADYWNTCYKMAYKRALTSATLAATGSSDFFTQDVEDMPEVFSTPASKPTTPEKPVAEETPTDTTPPPKEEVKPEPPPTPGTLSAQEKLYKELALRSGCDLTKMEVALTKCSSFEASGKLKGIVLHEPDEDSTLTNIWKATDKWCNTTIGKLRKLPAYTGDMPEGFCTENDEACDHSIWHDGNVYPLCGDTLVFCPHAFGKDRAPF